MVFFKIHGLKKYHMIVERTIMGTPMIELQSFENSIFLLTHFWFGNSLQNNPHNRIN